MKTKPKRPAKATKVDVGSMFKTPTKGSKKKEYPLIEGATELVDQIIESQEKMETAKAILDQGKGELVALAVPLYFEACEGAHEIPSSLAAEGSDKEILIVFSSRYSSVPEEAEEEIAAIIGDDGVEEYFEQKIEIRLDSTKINEEARADFLGALSAICIEYGAKDAVTAKGILSPKPHFHEARHRDFTPEQNLELHEICPCVIQVKTKTGR